ncbi:MAG TPA: Ig-like domain-containing protein, partial [Albitalea sp.]|nr:Ig-like domain-containing protein [Albitalea sp.]
MKEPSRRHAVTLLGAGLLLAACGGGNDSGGGGGGGGDTQPPSVALTSPADFADGLTGMLTLTATASDNVAVAAVEFQVDGVSVGSSVDTSTYAAGQHVVRARARDTSGNLSPWASATVRFGGSASVPQGFIKDDAWVGGISAGTALAQAPDGRLFVCEQGGTLRVVKNGALLGT